MAQAPSILFVHDHFPAQFGGFGAWLAARGWRVAFATMASVDPAAARRAGIRILRYAPHRAPAPQTHPFAQPLDRAAITAQAFVRTALAARAQGYAPDVIVAHSGWGAGMFARDVFPRAAYVPYCEWWYRWPGADVEYLARLDGSTPDSRPDAPMHERARNAPIAMDLAAADAALCPTRFQAAQFPPVFRDRLTVLHDGIDTTVFRPDTAARRGTLGGRVAEDARVITYATRGMEPHRGFPQFAAALARVLAADPRAVAVIAGENRVAYGGNRLRSVDWKARALAEHDLDPARVHFTGRLGRSDYLALLRRSDAHVYLTVPFVLSWSMLEAMATGCAMVVSDTEPVREFADAEAAALVDLARVDTLADGIRAMLDDPAAAEARRARAVEIVRDGLDAETLNARRAGFLAAVAA